jgi:hypothetical protein
MEICPVISSYLKARLALAAAITATLALAAPVANAVGAVPSGEVDFASGVVEPVYNNLDGSFGYLLTPQQATVKANIHTVSEIYVVVYPTDAAGVIGTVNCQHQPADNCPDHGPPISGLAEATVPGVYGNGVWGHDHLASIPAAPDKAGGEFNVDWLPVAVMFNTPEAVTHITTLSQLNDARAHGLITEIPLTGAIFHGSTVSANVYARGTPVVPAPPVP